VYALALEIGHILLQTVAARIVFAVGAGVPYRSDLGSVYDVNLYARFPDNASISTSY
jgi:hypothetical protein